MPKPRPRPRRIFREFSRLQFSPVVVSFKSFSFRNHLLSVCQTRKHFLHKPYISQFRRQKPSLEFSSSLHSMATAPASTSEAILLTEKKVDMTLDDIIKMSKKSSSKASTPRASNKSRRFPISGGTPQGRISPKVQRYMDSRSSLRQGLLAQKRSNFQGNQFPLAREVARKAAAAPIRNGPFSQNRVANQNMQRPATLRNAPMNRPIEKVKMVPKQRLKTLDALFANMKEQRMRQQQPMTARGKKAGRQGTQHWRGRGGAAARNGTQGRGGSSAGTGTCL